jgi:Ras-related protein Rab-21
VQGTDSVVQLHIWDTLGQEKFKSMAPIFFRRSVGAFLVYDVTNEESFVALKGWVEQLNNNADGKIVVMLLGNKCDLPNKVVTYQMG